MCFRSLLSNLRELTLVGVAVSLPALQPVATRLRELALIGSRLQGSADGFLTRGWTTALTMLSLCEAQVETATLAAAFELPALVNLDITAFRRPGGVSQLDQFTSSCSNIRALKVQLDRSQRGAERAAGCAAAS